MSTTPRPEQPDGSPAEVLHPAYEQVRSVLRAGLEQPVAAPAEVRDAALAAAMAEAVALNPSVPSLTARRSIRLEGSQRWMAAAAGLVVLFGLGTVARNLGDTSGSAGSASRALDASVAATPTAEMARKLTRHRKLPTDFQHFRQRREENGIGDDVTAHHFPQKETNNHRQKGPAT